MQANNWFSNSLRMMRCGAVVVLLLALTACGDDAELRLEEQRTQQMIAQQRTAQIQREAAEFRYQSALVAAEQAQIEADGRVRAWQELGHQIGAPASVGIVALLMASLLKTVLHYHARAQRLRHETGTVVLQTATELFTTDKITMQEYSRLVQGALAHQSSRSAPRLMDRASS
jgi:hypothetical protein